MVGTKKRTLLDMRFLLIFVILYSAIFADDIKLSWYSWNGFQEYNKDKENFFDTLEPTNRIFLSFNAKEIINLKYMQIEKDELNSFLLKAKKHNINVELLIGDHTYVYPKNHHHLLELIEFFKEFEFSGLQLDIEPSGLKSYDEKLWMENISALMIKVSKTTDLDVGFSLNHALAKPYILKKLQASKVDEVIIMYYSINSLNIEQKLNNIMKKNQNLKFSLALSIEPLSVLSKNETFAIYGKEKSLVRWKNINDTLKHNNNFVDIVIQSLYDYSKAKR